MSVRNHRVVAVSILLAGVVVVVAWGRSQAEESAELQATRQKFQGDWVATLVQSGATLKLEGTEAEACQAEFDGKNVVFHNLNGGIDARGSVYLEGRDRVDFKLDAGWIIGVYAFDGEMLKLALNRFAETERLGVTTHPRPRQVKPGDRHDFYVFRRATR
jgi:hypothetical protein